MFKWNIVDVALPRVLPILASLMLLTGSPLMQPSSVEASPFLGCAICYPKECEKVEASEACKFGKTLDYCGCCLTCANGPNERCGGVSNLFGTCADGLQCLRYDNKPKLITFNIAGRCVPREEYEAVIAEANSESPLQRSLENSARDLMTSVVPLVDTAVTAVRAGVDGLVAPLKPVVEAAAQRTKERQAQGGRLFNLQFPPLLPSLPSIFPSFTSQQQRKPSAGESSTRDSSFVVDNSDNKMRDGDTVVARSGDGPSDGTRTVKARVLSMPKTENVFKERSWSPTTDYRYRRPSSSSYTQAARPVHGSYFRRQPVRGYQGHRSESDKTAGKVVDNDDEEDYFFEEDEKNKDEEKEKKDEKDVERENKDEKDKKKDKKNEEDENSEKDAKREEKGDDEGEERKGEDVDVEKPGVDLKTKVRHLDSKASSSASYHHG